MTEKSPKHLYTVALRFYGEPSEISSKLNLQASYAVTQADIDKRPIKLKRTPHWSFTGNGIIGFQDEWENLEEGLNFLLNILQDKKSQIIELSKISQGFWWIGHFQSSFDGGATLSAKLLANLSNFEIPLFIDNYFSD